jgi:hypothetical protein
MADRIGLRVRNLRTCSEHTFSIGTFEEAFSRAFSLGSAPECGVVLEGVAPRVALFRSMGHHRYLEPLVEGIVNQGLGRPIGKPFRIGMFPVTVGDFEVKLEEDGFKQPPNPAPADLHACHLRQYTTRMVLPSSSWAPRVGDPRRKVKAAYPGQLTKDSFQTPSSQTSSIPPAHAP